MTLAHATDGKPSGGDAGPDSGNLRVSLATAHESGIPPARDRLTRATDSDAALQQLEQVLVESARAEANLGLLLRGLRHLTTGASAAQEANAVLMQELEALRIRISKVYESESLLRQRVQSLENAVDAAERDRQSWLVQEDAFLAGLLDDHEQKLFDVERTHERRLAELDLELEEMRLQRDSARAEATRMIYERDAAVALLNEPVAMTERDPTPPAASSSPSASRIPLGSVKLPKPVLKAKPELASRPLIGYALSAANAEQRQYGESAEERLERSQPGSSSPQK
jgi:hypothetical protein